MGYKSITQIVLIILSLVVIFTYIKPTFAQIRDTQNELFVYQDAVDKAAEFNRLLRELVTIEKSFSQQDRAALDKFLPAEIDEVKVMRDLENIADQSGVKFESVSAGEFSSTESARVEGQAASNQPVLNFQDFQFSMVAKYDDIKNFLRRLEANAYIFEIANMNFGSVDNKDRQATVIVDNDPDYDVSFSLRVYAQGLTVDNL